MDQSIKKWQEGKEYELKKQYSQAISAYKEGCELMYKWLKFDKMEVRKKQLMISIDKYIDHIQELKALEELDIMAAECLVENFENDIHGNDNDDEEDDLTKLLKELLTYETDIFTFNDLPGMDDVKQILSESIIMPKKFPHLFPKGKTSLKSVLLYGIEGTPKKFMAQCLAGELTQQCIHLQLQNIINKYSEYSQELITLFFEVVNEDDEKMVFVIHDIDLLLQSGYQNNNDEILEAKNELLKGIQKCIRSNNNSIIIGITDHPGKLDPSILYYFQGKIEVPLPDFKSRKQTLINSMRATDNNITDEQYSNIANKTYGYLSSDLETLVDKASYMPLRQLSSCKWWKNTWDGYTVPAEPYSSGAYQASLVDVQNKNIKKSPVTYQHFLQALDVVKPTVKEQDKYEIRQFKQKYGN